MEILADEQAWAEADAYVRYLGMVAHAWNSFHKALCSVFTAIIRGRERDVVEAVWHSTFSDRAQREMLRHALEATTDILPMYKDDLLWVLKRANDLSAMRDNAIHAPVLGFGGEQRFQIVASSISGHRRAKNLIGKDLLVEFDYCKRYTENLTAFTYAALECLSPRGGSAPWPSKPAAPNRRPRTTILGRQLRRPPP